MGDIQTRSAERRLQRALERAEMPVNDPAVATKRLQQLAATLPATRPGVTNDVEASKKHARALARELKLDKGAAYDLVLAAELHEVGKATIDRDVLYAPGELDVEERAAIEAHVENGARLVAPTDRPVVVSALALQNERHDGTGPSGISGRELPLIAEALSVISAYVAMTSKRPFRPALDREHALEVLRNEAGEQFDPDVVEAFISTIPQKRFAVAAAGAGASIARPIRNVQLAYRRHGRVSTVVVSSFSAAAVLIGASTLAPGGIGQTIERLSWPTQTGQEASVEGSAPLLANGDAVAASSTIDDADPVAASLHGVAEVFASDLAGGTTTEVTQIESGYSYGVGNEDFDDKNFDSEATYADDGTSAGTDDDADEPEEAEANPGNYGDQSEEPSESPAAEPEPSESPAAEPEPSESPTPEPEPSESPTSDNSGGAPSPSDDARDESTPDEAPSSDAAPEETPSGDTSSEDTDDENERDRRNRKGSDKFKAYQSDEQDEEADDVEASDSETDGVEADEEPTDQSMEDEAVVQEEPEATPRRDSTPSWGSIH